MSPITRACAGPTGADVRSDLAVSYEPGDAALTISVSSRVDYLYGDAVTAAVRRVATAFAV